MAPLAVFLLVLLGLVVLPWDPALIPGPMERNTTRTAADEPIDAPVFQRRSLEFPCHGEACSAWLYVPRGVVKPPVVVMAHGLGAQKEFGLAAYGERFASHGIASFVFDYRTFGGSSGTPRHRISPARHVQDYKAAVDFVRADLDQVVDGQQLFLWGTSMSGGHVLVAAADLGPDVVKGVISQVPFTDGHATFARNVVQRGWLAVVRGVLGGLHDLLRSAAQYPAAYLRISGPVGSHSLMQLTPEEATAYWAKIPEVRQGGWRNMARARFVLEARSYRPVLSVPQVQVPILFLLATRDRLCPPEGVRDAAALATRGQLLELDANHFEVYSGRFLEQSLVAMVKFIEKAVVGPEAYERLQKQQQQQQEAAADAGAEAVPVKEEL